MASTITFGTIETRIRRDLLNDNDPDCYRWNVSTVMSRMNEAVVDIVSLFNQWAGYNQETGKRIYNIHTIEIENLCNSLSLSIGDITQLEKTNLRNITIPIDDRYADAIAYISASRLLETDDSDTMNAQKSAQFLAMGKEYAVR